MGRPSLSEGPWAAEREGYVLSPAPAIRVQAVISVDKIRGIPDKINNAKKKKFGHSACCVGHSASEHNRMLIYEPFEHLNIN